VAAAAARLELAAEMEGVLRAGQDRLAEAAAMFEATMAGMRERRAAMIQRQVGGGACVGRIRRHRMREETQAV
jgi:hypothetical protein